MTKQWVAVSDVVFLDPNLEENDRSAIEKICSASNKTVVCVPDYVSKQLKEILPACVTRMSPEFICTLFKLNQNLLHNQLDVKKQLLNYILLYDINCCDYLEDVPLLPLVNCSFVSFKLNADPIYISSPEHPRSLLPGLDYLFLADKYCPVMTKIFSSGNLLSFLYYLSVC